MFRHRYKNVRVTHGKYSEAEILEIAGNDIEEIKRALRSCDVMVSQEDIKYTMLFVANLWNYPIDCTMDEVMYKATDALGAMSKGGKFSNALIPF